MEFADTQRDRQLICSFKCLEGQGYDHGNLGPVAPLVPVFRIITYWFEFLAPADYATQQNKSWYK
jgi:hypothetical protein